MSRIRLHSKYGVNPAIPKCFYCLKDKNMIYLLGANGGREAPRNAVFDKEPCETCRGYMKQGVILISAKEPKPGEDAKNPFRTGGFWVVKDDMIRRAIKPESVMEHALKARVMFISNEAAKAWQLPGWDKLFGAVVDVQAAVEPLPEAPKEPPAQEGTIMEGGSNAEA